MHILKKVGKGQHQVFSENGVHFADLDMDVDGFYKCWFPINMNGYLTEYDLMFLTETLKDLNKEWEQQIALDFAD